MLQTLSEIIDRVIDTIECLFFPASCCACGTPVASTGVLCSLCSDSLLEPTEPLCRQCAVPLSGEQHIDLCPPCLSEPPPFEKILSAYAYGGQLKVAIHRFKYGNRPQLCGPLTQLMVQLWLNLGICPRADVVVPVPLSATRLRKRGFNQATEVAHRLGLILGLPVRQAVKRTQATRPQAGLAFSERVANVRDVFEVSQPHAVEGRRVLLVDDIVTTGATVAELARQLLRQGASAVEVATLARALID